MTPHNLEIVLQMEALKARLSGMEAANANDKLQGFGRLTYSECHFTDIAEQFDGLLSEVSHLID